jgi:molybdate/tungstate transport system substrate-binding protein
MRFSLPTLLALALCTRQSSAQSAPLLVFSAGSLARPLRAALDSFAAHNGITVQQENSGSLEAARKLTDLHRIPDVIALADQSVFTQLLMPRSVAGYTQFARNRMVLAYTAKSRFANEISAANWTAVLLRAGVETGRADPSLDPNGYRTLLVTQLAERWYQQPGLSHHLLDASPPRNVRPNETDVLALLEAGEFDYAWTYESMAQAAGVRYLRLPPQIDLSDANESARYAEVWVKVAGATRRDSVIFRGEPIVYGIAVPVGAPDRSLGEKFVAWLTSPEGIRVLRAAKLDALDQPRYVAGTP